MVGAEKCIPAPVISRCQLGSVPLHANIIFGPRLTGVLTVVVVVIEAAGVSVVTRVVPGAVVIAGAVVTVGVGAGGEVVSGPFVVVFGVTITLGVAGGEGWVTVAPGDTVVRKVGAGVVVVVVEVAVVASITVAGATVAGAAGVRGGMSVTMA